MIAVSSGSAPERIRTATAARVSGELFGHQQAGFDIRRLDGIMFGSTGFDPAGKIADGFVDFFEGVSAFLIHDCYAPFVGGYGVTVFVVD